jgi:hypothetical protein
MKIRSYVLFFIILTLSFISCVKNEKLDFYKGTNLNFSSDSILFDTVFTEIGTTTRILKIYNKSKNTIQIENIKLSGGENSSFKINFNGIDASEVKNFKIKGKDSAYIFIKAFINPSNADRPFIIKDSILFTNKNGEQQKINIKAYAQNAIYLNQQKISTTTTFIKGKPYIIYNNLTVNEGITLNIEAGAKLYFHKDARLIVNGSLLVNGTKTDSVLFSSDRLERLYSNEAGQWNGIYLKSSSRSNKINYAIIKNSTIGIQVDSLNQDLTEPKLLLSNTILKNHASYAIYSINSNVIAINNLIFNCAKQHLLVENGGIYKFYHNTFSGNRLGLNRISPLISLSNNNKSMNALFINNIIWGVLDSEISLNNNQLSTINFKNNLIKTKDEISENINNKDPQFINPQQLNFKIKKESPANNVGLEISDSMYNQIIKFDLLEKERVIKPNLGCYEN